jgi:hypothetical protein
MAGTPTWERPPAIRPPWYDFWRAAMAKMKEMGTWSSIARPLLDEYVAALRVAEDHRALAEADPVQVNRESGLPHPHGCFASADRELRRAAMLAGELLLTPKAQKALMAAAKAAETAPPAEPSVLGRLDELGARRAAA